MNKSKEKIKKKGGFGIRAKEEDVETFKEISKTQFNSQGEFLSHLLNLHAMNNLGVVMPGRKTEIDTFLGYTNRLIKMYENSVDMYLEVEEKIRCEVNVEFEVKLGKLQFLEEQIEKFDKEIKTLILREKSNLEKITDLENIKNELKEDKKILEAYLQQDKEIISNNISLLKKAEDELIETKQKIEKYKAYKKHSEHLKKKEQQYIKKIKKLTIELNGDKLEISNCKEDNHKLNEAINKYNLQILELQENNKKTEEMYTNKIEKLNKEFKDRSETIKANYKKYSENAMEIERKKLDSVEQKYKNKIKELEVAYKEQLVNEKEKLYRDFINWQREIENNNKPKNN